MAAAVVLVLALLCGCGMGGPGVVSGVMASSDVHYVGRHEATLLRNRVHGMFRHAYDSYMAHAFPLDELKPMTCSGHDTLGGYSLTLVDALDMLAVVGNRSEFVKSVRWLGQHLSFNKNKTVSLFETNIRILGGLLSAHLLASDDATGMHVPGYANELLLLAEDLGRRLLPAFDTPTGIPFGSINLRHGVSATESQVTATAGGGTLLLEFGVLSRLTGDPVYEEVARAALVALWERRSALGLVGAHISVMDGEWTHRDAGIGTSIDSFYEYLIKGHVLFGDADLLEMFFDAYNAVLKHLFQDPWYVEVNMDMGMIVWPLFNSLQAFWPGLQVLVGDVERAVRTHRAFASVWRRYGFTPEGFNLQHGQVQPGQQSYPLRPELAESTYWLYKATRDPSYLELGREMVESLELARCPCGFCHIKDVERHTLANHMESFFLSETVKYLYLLFDLAATNGDNIVDNGPYQYVFTTEGHILPLTPEISLPPSEHCTYLGAYCGTPKSISCRATDIPLPPEKPPQMPQQAAAAAAAAAAAGSPLSAILEAFATASKAALKQVGSSLGVLRPGDTAAAAAAAAGAVAAAAAAAAGGGGQVRVEVAEGLPISLSVAGQSVRVSEAGVQVVQLGSASASATAVGAQDSASVAVDIDESTSSGLGTTSDRSSSSDSSGGVGGSTSSSGGGDSSSNSDGGGEARRSRQGDTSSGERSDGGTGTEAQYQEQIHQKQQQEQQLQQHQHQHQQQQLQQQNQEQQQELQPEEAVHQEQLKDGEVDGHRAEEEEDASESRKLKQSAPAGEVAPATGTPATAAAAAAAEAASDGAVSSEDSRREVMPAPSHSREAAAVAQAQEGAGTGAPVAVEAKAVDAAAASGATAASDAAAAAAEPSAAASEEVTSSSKAPARKETISVRPAPTKHVEDDEDDDDEDDDGDDDDDDDDDEDEEKQKRQESKQLGEKSTPAAAGAPPQGGNPPFSEPQVRCEGISFWRSLGVSP